MKETKNWKPGGPHHNFIHVLHVHHTKDKNELVEDKIPEFILDVLLFWDSKFPEDCSLNNLSKEDKAAIRHVDQCLEERKNYEDLENYPKYIFVLFNTHDTLFSNHQTN